MKICKCKNPEFALCRPTCFDDQGVRLLSANWQFVNEFVCYECGGIAKGIPKNYDVVTGQTIIERLVRMGIARGVA